MNSGHIEKNELTAPCKTMNNRREIEKNLRVNLDRAMALYVHADAAFDLVIRRFAAPSSGSQPHTPNPPGWQRSHGGVACCQCRPDRIKRSHDPEMRYLSCSNKIQISRRAPNITACISAQGAGIDHDGEALTRERR